MKFVFEPEQQTPSMSEMRAPAVRIGPIKEHGGVIVDGIQAGTTLRCPHCGGHFLLSKGNLEVAKRTLGALARPKVFCVKCDRLTCGRKGCHPDVVGCIPIEARLEYAEGKRDPRYLEAIEKMLAESIPLL